MQILVQTQTQKQLEDVLSRLSNVQSINGNYRADCPSHEDAKQKLSIKEGHCGILLKCWIGCSFTEIVSALEMEPGQLFYDQKDSRPNNPRTPERASLNFRWNWRKQVSELQTIAEVRSIRAKDFLRLLSLETVEAMTALQQKKVWSAIRTADQWIAIGESVDELVYDLRQRLRREEVHYGDLR